MSILDEIVQDLPDLDALVVPMGVGGLVVAMVQAAKRLCPDVAIYTVEPETAAPMNASIEAGRPSAVQYLPSFVDAIGTPEILSPVFDILADKLAGSEVVAILDARRAVASLFRAHRLVEGEGACALVAAENLASHTGHRRIACILTGGNLPEHVLHEILESHR